MYNFCIIEVWQERVYRTLYNRFLDIEVKANVIYERDTDDIINQYIIFCKVFNEQTKQYGMAQKAVTETIYICKDRNVLREYLLEREKEVVTIIMKLIATSKN